MKIKANGIEMNYEIKGQGKDLVFIHGAGDNLKMWYHQVPVFSKNYRVITYDVRGAGGTESSSTEYSLSLFARDLYELMTAIPVKGDCFVGYSMGGYIALSLAIDHPEIAKALILVNSAAGLITPPQEAVQRRQANIQLLEEGNIRKVAEIMTTGSFSPGFKTKNPKEFETSLKLKLAGKPDHLARVMRAIGSARRLDLTRIKCPVLIIVGEYDLYLGVDGGKRLQQEIVGSKLVILPTGHAAAMESPEMFNSAVSEFLSQIKAR